MKLAKRKLSLSFAWRSGVPLSFGVDEGPFCVLLGLFCCKVVTPLVDADAEPAGRCVTGFVLPLDQALGKFGLLHKPKSQLWNRTQDKAQTERSKKNKGNYVKQMAHCNGCK
jgi:hypothetical protein